MVLGGISGTVESLLGAKLVLLPSTKLGMVLGDDDDDDDDLATEGTLLGKTLGTMVLGRVLGLELGLSLGLTLGN